MSMIELLKADREQHKADAKALVAKATAEQRDLNPVEALEFRAHEETLEQLDARLDELRDIQIRRAERDELAKRIQPEPTPEGQREFRQPSFSVDERGGVWRTGNEAQTYRRGGGPSFFSDLIGERRGDRGAAERLERHDRETRAVSSTALGDGLVPPQYLSEEYAKVLRAGRVTFNLTRKLPMPPEGNTVTLPRGTTGTVVAAQSGDNSSVTSVDFDSTDLVVPIRTYSGFNDVSRQTIERGHLADEIIFQDLMEAHNKTLNYDVINGGGTNGTHTGILSSTAGAVAVSVTAAGFHATNTAIANAAAKIGAGRYIQPDVVIMHPRRWGFLVAQSDSQGRPMIDLTGTGSNASGRGDVTGEGFVGSIAGLPVYLDASIPTTVSTSTFSGAAEDVIIVANSNDLLGWDDEVRRFRFDDVGSGTLTSRLLVVSYTAFTAKWQPAGLAIISGSSLATTLG